MDAPGVSSCHCHKHSQPPNQQDAEQCPEQVAEDTLVKHMRLIEVDEKCQWPAASHIVSLRVGGACKDGIDDVKQRKPWARRALARSQSRGVREVLVKLFEESFGHLSLGGIW